MDKNIDNWESKSLAGWQTEFLKSLFTLLSFWMASLKYMMGQLAEFRANCKT
jgi:hypothetical protein